MESLRICFWVSAACVAYTYALYPLLIALRARFFARAIRIGQPSECFSIIITAFNESTRIRGKTREMLSLIGQSGLDGELIVVSDGSTDGTAAAARDQHDPRLRVIELEKNVGKAAALTIAAAEAQSDVLVFADVRQSWDPHALEHLLGNFADPNVGAVSGELVLEAGPGVIAGVGLYWRYEKWIRRCESMVHSCVGVTGAISAVRRGLFGAIPAGTILDDVYWPLLVVMQGARVAHEERARAYDRLPERPGDELRRKVRTLCGNFQLLIRLPGAVVPWRNPVWFQLISHKLMRLAVPWALLSILATSLLLPGWGYRAFFWAQLAFYALALAGSRKSVATRSSIASAATAFVVLNAAALMAFWVWVSGRTNTSWQKVSYGVRPHAGAPVQ